MLRRRRECLAAARHRFTTYESLIKPEPPKADASLPRRKPMPVERQSITHRFSIGGHGGCVTASMYEDGTVGEIILSDMGEDSSLSRGIMDAFASSISLSLQYGIPLEMLVQKYSHMRFEPQGITQNPEIPFAKSLPDYIMRWLASRFLDTSAHEEFGVLTPEVRARRAAAAKQADRG